MTSLFLKFLYAKNSPLLYPPLLKYWNWNKLCSGSCCYHDVYSRRVPALFRRKRIFQNTWKGNSSEYYICRNYWTRWHDTIRGIYQIQQSPTCHTNHPNWRKNNYLIWYTRNDRERYPKSYFSHHKCVFSLKGWRDNASSLGMRN